MPQQLLVATRASPLALAQVTEVADAIAFHNPAVKLIPVPMTTIGDRDQQTPLRTLPKDDFFTRELDDALLQRRCHIAIHAAKDLPDPMADGLTIVALTSGLDSGDVLVMPHGSSFYLLPPGSLIATSSPRRESSVKALRPDLSFRDLRGTIHQRLALLDSGAAAGVVVAEAALLRLGLSHLNRIRLPGPYTPLQGRLAIVARIGDDAMDALFRPLDSPSTPKPYIQLHVGLTPPPPPPQPDVTTLHCPLIATVPRDYRDPSLATIAATLSAYSHCIFTSKNSVKYFLELLRYYDVDPHKTLATMTILTIGTATAATLLTVNIPSHSIINAPIATAEGLCRLLDTLPLDSHHSPHLLWPHSSLSRTTIGDFLTARKIPWQGCILYDTVVSAASQLQLPSLDSVDEVIFTSPSTIDAFVHLYGALPNPTTTALRPIGPITAQHLSRLSHPLPFHLK